VAGVDKAGVGQGQVCTDTLRLQVQGHRAVFRRGIGRDPGEGDFRLGHQRQIGAGMRHDMAIIVDVDLESAAEAGVGFGLGQVHALAVLHEAH